MSESCLLNEANIRPQPLEVELANIIAIERDGARTGGKPPLE